MIGNVIKDEKINTDANSNIKGIGLQKLRVFDRLLEAILKNKRSIMCAMEYIDDVIEMDISEEKTAYTTEQNKSYSSSFSMNSHEVKNSLRIFFDTWRVIVESAESINFVFYTNTTIKQEYKTGVLKELDLELPEEPLLKLLIEKRYSESLPFIIPIFREYYIDQHKKHAKDIDIYIEMIDSMTFEKWIEFFELIEWKFGEKTEIELIASVNEKVSMLCHIHGIDQKFVAKIVEQIIGKIELHTFEKDFLRKMIQVGDIKCIFLEYALEAKVQDKLDPIHEKWDDIECSDIRDLKDKFLDVCPEYNEDLLYDLQDEYTDGVFEQRHHTNLKQVKAYNYRVYKACEKLIKRKIAEIGEDFSPKRIAEIIDVLTDEAEVHVNDKAKTYQVAFSDRDMIRKTVLMLFQDCYIAFNERE